MLLGLLLDEGQLQEGLISQLFTFYESVSALAQRNVSCTALFGGYPPYTVNLCRAGSTAAVTADWPELFLHHKTINYTGIRIPSPDRDIQNKIK